MSVVPLDFGDEPDAARRYAAVRAIREARAALDDAAAVAPAWGPPAVRGDRRRRGRLPREEDGGGNSWDDAVRAVECGR